MDRITRDEMLMGMAEIVAKRGTCARLQVGCVVSRDGRVISTGYNGAPAGIPHCDHSNEPPPVIVMPTMTDEQLKDFVFDARPGRIMEIPKHQITTSGCQVASHAEQNAIAYAARHGVALDQSELHVTHAPCLACARSIINAGIQKVTYQTPYRLTEGVDLLRQAKIIVIDPIDSV